jgi:hypothetical protein
MNAKLVVKALILPSLSLCVLILLGPVQKQVSLFQNSGMGKGRKELAD